MLTSKLVKALIAGSITILCCFCNAFAQQPKLEAPTSLYKSVALDADQKLVLSFTIEKLGSVTIRVVQRPKGDPTEPAVEPKGIIGFKVRLRSNDPGYERWYLDQFTDDDGTYTFECLRPGKYRIELDPADLPN